MEESNAWRHPVDLIALLEGAFEVLPAVLAEGQAKYPETGATESDRLVDTLLGDDPAAIVEMLLAALRAGDPPHEVAGWVTYAAARRIVHFHTSNEFGDWDTALHTFTFANAVQMGLRRVHSPELVRGVFDAAMSIYLDRFLNIPAAPLPVGEANADPDALLVALPDLFDQHQPIDETGRLIASYLASGGDASKLRAALGGLLLREDRDFHTIQTVEAAFRQQEWLAGTSRAHHMLVAAGRYLAAHVPTMRSQNQTYDIAQRLSRGDHLHED
jgi:hypothetical protein